MNAATAEPRPSTDQISGLIERVTFHSEESGFCAFTFLGFTHFCGKRRSNGAFTVWRKTAKKRMVAKLHAIKAELRLRMHEPAAEVGAWLRKVVTGYYQYHAVPGNIDRLSVFGQRLRRLWWITLRRRSQQPVTRDRVTRIATCHSLDPSTTRSAPLSGSTLSRHSSKVGAVCVNAPVRSANDRPYRDT